MEHNRSDGHNTKLQLLIQPNIRLDCVVYHLVGEILNHGPVHGESQKRIRK
jgi:hypothetical protein